MNRPVVRRTTLLIALLLFAVGAAFFTSTQSEASGCSACLGPVNRSTGFGTGYTCAEATQAANSDAIASAPLGTSCVPCETSLTSSCFYILDCSPGQGCWAAFATYHYKCKTCMPF